MKGSRAIKTIILLVLGVLVTVFSGCWGGDGKSGEALRLLEAERPQIEHQSLVLPNGLKVMLMHDPLANRSAASLSVGAGSMEDPAQLQGLAHFLEHMLFLGTKKYPTVGGYQAFLAQHGGFSNAYTADDHTNYHFEVDHPAFAEGLDRFSRFFIDPLFSPEYTRKELAAVDSEHSKNISSDLWRIRQVKRDFYRPDHPLNHFSTGNSQTLKGAKKADLEAFFTKYYAPGRMTLALYSPLPLKAQEALVLERFSAIQDNLAGRTQGPIKRPAVFLDQKKTLRLITVQTVADIRTLGLEFPMASTRPDQESRAMELAAFVLGHEGPNSLLSSLKAENLATSLSAGQMMDTQDFASFQIEVELTPKGLEQWPLVTERIMGAIHHLQRQGIPKHIFEENKVMAGLNHRFRPRGQASEQVLEMSALMQAWPLESLPDGPYLWGRFQNKAVAAVLAQMTADNLMVTLAAKNMETDKTDAAYGARYRYQELSGLDYQRLVAAKPPQSFSIPAPNPFIPQDTSLARPEGPLKFTYASWLQLQRDGLPAQPLEALRPLVGQTFPDLGSYSQAVSSKLAPEYQPQFLGKALQYGLTLPVKLVDSPQARIFFLPDYQYGYPKAYFNLRFLTPKAYATPRQAALASLYAQAMNEALNEYAYSAGMAGLAFSISAEKRGIELKVGGYSNRIVPLLEKVAGSMKAPQLDASRFDAIKEESIRNLRNIRFAQPYSQAALFREMALVRPAYDPQQIADEMGSIGLAELKSYAKTLFERTYLEAVAAGNLEPEKAKKAAMDALLRLSGSPLPAGERLAPRVIELAAGKEALVAQKLDRDNSLADFTYQAGEADPLTRTALQLAAQPLEDQFYTQMRTQAQLGYIVFAGYDQLRTTAGLRFLIQSGSYGPATLQTQMERFVAQFPGRFSKLPAADFERYRQATIKAKLARKHSMAEWADLDDFIAFSWHGDFDYLSRELEVLNNLTQPQVTGQLNQVLAKNPKRLVIRLYPNTGNSEAKPAAAAQQGQAAGSHP